MQQNQNAFTLIELLVVIILLGLLVYGSSQIQLSRVTQKQQVDLEAVKIRNIFEEVRNNSLLWKVFSGSTLAPDSWAIEINPWASQIRTSYQIWWIDYPFEDGSWDSKRGFELQELICFNLDKTSQRNITWIWTISFKDSAIEVNECSAIHGKIYSLTYGNEIFQNTIEFNSLSGVISRN